MSAGTTSTAAAQSRKDRSGPAGRTKRATGGTFGDRFRADLARDYLPGMPPVVTDQVFDRARKAAYSDGCGDYGDTAAHYEDLAALVNAVAEVVRAP